jgi:hypothetical protein
MWSPCAVRSRFIRMHIGFMPPEHHTHPYHLSYSNTDLCFRRGTKHLFTATFTAIAHARHPGSPRPHFRAADLHAPVSRPIKDNFASEGGTKDGLASAGRRYCATLVWKLGGLSPADDLWYMVAIWYVAVYTPMFVVIRDTCGSIHVSSIYDCCQSLTSTQSSDTPFFAYQTSCNHTFPVPHTTSHLHDYRHPARSRTHTTRTPGPLLTLCNTAPTLGVLLDQWRVAFSA